MVSTTYEKNMLTHTDFIGAMSKKSMEKWEGGGGGGRESLYKFSKFRCQKRSNFMDNFQVCPKNWYKLAPKRGSGPPK